MKFWSESIIRCGENAVADPEGVRGVQTNFLLSLNYFIFMGNFRRIGQTAQIEPISANLNPQSKNPGSAPETGEIPEKKHLTTHKQNLASCLACLTCDPS